MDKIKTKTNKLDISLKWSTEPARGGFALVSYKNSKDNFSRTIK